jgi:uncharacterized protein with LGFP repeats
VLATALTTGEAHANGAPLPTPSTAITATMTPVPPDPLIDHYAAAHPWWGAKQGGLRYGPQNGDFQYFTSGTVSDNSGQVHEVHGAIETKYLQLYRPVSVLGYPVIDQTPTRNGIGAYNHFQMGSIYWSPTTGAHEVHGAIRQEWASLGWEKSYIGYPTTDELITADGIGRYNLFQGGSIYWTPATGARDVDSLIGAKWASLGSERSVLGYPIADATFVPATFDMMQRFQYGIIYQPFVIGPGNASVEVHGAIYYKWASLGGLSSFLGAPTSDEYSCANVARCNIILTASGGAVAFP